MFRDKYRQQITWGITVFILLFMAIACYFLFLRWGNVVKGWNTISGILAPVSFGLIIAYLLDSLVSAFIHLFERIPLPARANKARWGNVYRALSIVASEVIFVLVIALLISSIIPQIIDSLMTIISNIDTYAANLEAWSTPLLEDYPAVKPYVLEQFKAAETFITDFLKNDLLSVITRVTSGLFEVGTYVYNFIIGLIVSIYLLFSKTRLIGHFKKLLYTLCPPAHANRTLEIARYTNRVFKAFLVGKLVDSTIIGLLCFLGTTLLRIPYSLLISIVVGVTNVIPYFGPFIGAIPSALLVLMLDPYKCLVFVIFIIVLQQIDGNLIGPKILGNTTGVSSLGVLISILVGGGLFGLPGMLVCVPTYAVLYSLIKGCAEQKLTKHGMPTETATYVTLDQIDPETLAPSAITAAQTAAAAENSGAKNLIKRAFGARRKKK